jgi:hypothetical protein
MYKSGGLSASKLMAVKQIISPKKERPYEEQKPLKLKPG